jgi:hypothetical protein
MPIKTNIKRFSRSKIPEPVIEEDVNEEEPTETIEPQEETNDDDFFDDSFLDELKGEEPIKVELPVKKSPKKKDKKIKTVDNFEPNFAIPDFQPSFISNKGSEILGAERRQRLVKIAQYKKLFANSEAVKKFTIKKNASVNELDDYLSELEVIVSLDGVENLLTDRILKGIQIVEGVSAKTDNFDLTGTADALKNNEMFYQLCKQLWLKYNTFAQIPPEYQMGLLLVTTMTMQMNKNREAKRLSYTLNQPYM